MGSECRIERNGSNRNLDKQKTVHRHYYRKNDSSTHLHFPTRHNETGSPTTTTKDSARVMAVFSSLMFERKPRSSFSEAASFVQVCLVRTVLSIMTRNCFPVINVKKFLYALYYYYYYYYYYDFPSRKDSA